jgi:hypothetical protein
MTNSLEGLMQCNGDIPVSCIWGNIVMDDDHEAKPFTPFQCFLLPWESTYRPVLSQARKASDVVYSNDYCVVWPPCNSYISSSMCSLYGTGYN